MWLLIVFQSCIFVDYEASDYIVPVPGNAMSVTTHPITGLYDVKYYAKWYSNNKADASYYHPVRCIQEPK